MKLAEILTGSETWCQEVLSDSQGRHCLIGALTILHIGSARYPDGSDRLAMQEVGRLGRLIRQYESGVSVPGPTMGWTVAGWNDDPSRTWDEVQTIVDLYDRDRMLNP